MKTVPLDVPMLETVHTLELPDAGETAWGVPIMDTDRFRQVIDAQPTGFRGLDGKNQQVIVEWLDDETGGVACMIKDPREVDQQFNGLRQVVNIDLVFTQNESYNVPGLIPGCPNKRFPSYPATHLGYLILANTPDLIAVQYPGTQDYITAYRSVNEEEPAIVPYPKSPNNPIGRKFLNLVARGRWPHDDHFFIAHGPAFVIGGNAFVEEVRALAKDVPDDEVDDRGGFIDDYGGYNQVIRALKRVENYLTTDDPATLYAVDYGYSKNIVPDGHQYDPEVMARFNAFAAHDILGVELPTSVMS